MRQTFLITIILIATNLTWGKTQFEFSPDQGQITYKTKGWPSLIVIEATGKGLQGNLVEEEGAVSGELKFEIASFDSGIESRDDHALKYLGADKQPFATIQLVNFKVPESFTGRFPFTGTVTLNEVSKPVQGEATLKTEDGKLQLHGEFILNFKDFNVDVPAWKGITVAEKVNVKIDSTVQKKNL